MGNKASPWVAASLVLAASLATAEQRTVEEIVVTAQKKEESVQDVPISISVLSGDFLEDAAVADMHELVKYAPNVRFTHHVTVFIRGFGTPFSTGAFDPGVGLVLDELSIPRETYMTDALFDLERFEVLRGPQGTLFGKNTPAGLFNVTTAMPTDEFSGSLGVRAGGLGVYRFDAAVGGPLGPLGKWAKFRLAVLNEEQEEDVESTLLGEGFPGTTQRAARLKLELDLVDDLEVLLIGSVASTESGFVSYIQSHGLRDSSVAFLRQFDPEFEDDGFNHQNSINLPEVESRDTDLLQANLRYHAGDLGPARETEAVAVLGVTGFDLNLPFDVDVSPADILNLDPATVFNYDQRSAELRFAGFVPAPFGFGEFELLLGGLFFQSDLYSDHRVVAGEHIDDYLLSPAGFELATGSEAPGGIGFTTLQQAADALGVPLPPTPGSLDGDGVRLILDQTTNSKALFGNAAWHATDRWTLSLGGRLTLEDKDVRLANRCLPPGAICRILMAEEFDERRDRHETDVSPKVTLQYAPIEEATLFVTRGQGFKSGGYNNLSFTRDSIEVDAEKVVSWEAGAKGTTLDGTLSYAATIFRMDAEDLQQQNVVGALVQTRNAASARSQGVELDFRWLAPWEPLSLIGAASITDARFKRYPGAIAPASSGAATQDLSGRRMPFVPKRQVNLTPTLRVPIARGLVVTAALDVLYRSNFFLDSDLDPKLLQDGYVMLDARLGALAFGESLSASAVVKNVTDVDALEFATDSILFAPGFLNFQEFQRNFLFEARYAF